MEAFIDGPQKDVLDIAIDIAHPNVHPDTLGYVYVANANLAEGVAMAAEFVVGVHDRADLIKDEKVDPLKASRFQRILGLVMNDRELEILRLAGVNSLEQLPAMEETAKNLWDATSEARQEVATQLAEFDERKNRILDLYCDTSVPDEIKEQKRLTGTDSHWAEWLSRSENMIHLGNFLTWHVGYIEETQNDVDIQAEFQAQKLTYQVNLAQGIEDGWLDESASAAIPAVMKVQCFVGDVFDTLMNEQLGYHPSGSDVIVVAVPLEIGAIEGEKPTALLIRRVAPHEFNHAVLGQFGQRWLNEAITQHIIEAMHYGDVDTVDPDKRPDTDVIYTAERKLLAHLLTAGKQKIPGRLATRAYSAAKGKHAREARDEFEAAIEDAWGGQVQGFGSVLDFVNTYVATQERELQFKAENKDLTKSQIQTLALEKTLKTLQSSPDKVFNPRGTY